MAQGASIAASPAAPKKFYQSLYVQVLVAIAIGIALGHFYPSVGESMKPLGDAFIKMIKMLIAPIIFLTVVHGIAGMEDMKKVGRVGFKALIYFEVLTTIALVLGMVIVNVWEPGAGMNVDPATLDTKSIASYAAKAQEQGTIAFLMHIIPTTVVGAFAEGEILQVLFIAILFAFGLQSLGDKGRPMLHLIDQASGVFFKIVGILMKVAPIGAFGAMAFTIGKYGVDTLISLGQLMAAFYATCLIFIFGVLGVVARVCGFSITRFIRNIREELLIVLGTSSSESALPRLMVKLNKLGVEKSVVGLVVPTGYSFNLDGTCIYLTMAAIFLAQATNTDLTIWQELGILAVLLLTSKGAAGVTGSGFIVLAATLATVGHIPVASIALILGVDRFMSEARALTNLIGNGVATLVVAKWEGALDTNKLHAELANPTGIEEAVERPRTVLAPAE
ncbi:C4-dicarboxylate transporter DctA [Niveispirillum lacus]|uniref:C4-dicarboxylate transport protein n=1 Tax=Niveispirillum lacus TaxID=1981099 RepID=A0A255YQA0_9PROT|nr:dicarboxylate/amino acid:cation symporter [Niveispirillum lacus]OYQ31416.1 C4-dicarboxylate transporter DctA [Niveispirillum lacus]